MKTYSFITVFAILAFSGCVNKNDDSHTHDDEAIHEHEDGSTHQNHEEDNFSQEEFTIDSNAQSSDPEETTHSHEDGSHQH